IGADLEVIRMHHWDAARNFSELGRYWVPTSPNLPTMDSVVVYPGLVMIEGTNLSEGRGTTLPFQLIGAPYLKSADQFVTRVLELLRPVGGAAGVFLRPCEFIPTFHKWKDELCRGMHIVVKDWRQVRS